MNRIGMALLLMIVAACEPMKLVAFLRIASSIQPDPSHRLILAPQ